MKIKTVEELRKLYNKPSGRTILKELNQLEEHSENFINNSPFVMVGSHSNSGDIEVSPKGGKPGFVKITDKNKIVIPDSKGNNRQDSLTNIIETGKIELLFLIPGIDETLRVNGSAYLSTNKAHLELFLEEEKKPNVVVIVTIDKLFMHCAKAFNSINLFNIQI